MINIRFVKGQKIDDVQTVSLLDLGFKYDVEKSQDRGDYSREYRLFRRKIEDVPEFYGHQMEKRYLKYLLESKSKIKAFEKFYSDICILGISREEAYAFLERGDVSGLDYNLANNLIEQFIYLIYFTIPRSIQDLYYFVGLEPKSIYWIIFELAVERMGLCVEKDYRKTTFGQILGFQRTRILEMLFEGKRFMFWSKRHYQKIYDETCATLKAIQSVIYEHRPDFPISDWLDYFKEFNIHMHLNKTKRVHGKFNGWVKLDLLLPIMPIESFLKKEKVETPIGDLIVSSTTENILIKFRNARSKSMWIEKNHKQKKTYADRCINIDIEISECNVGDKIIVVFEKGILSPDGGGEGFINSTGKCNGYHVAMGTRDVDEDPEQGMCYFSSNCYGGFEFQIIDNPKLYSDKSLNKYIRVTSAWCKSSNQNAYEIVSFLTS